MSSKLHKPPSLVKPDASSQYQGTDASVPPTEENAPIGGLRSNTSHSRKSSIETRSSLAARRRSMATRDQKASAPARQSESSSRRSVTGASAPPPVSHNRNFPSTTSEPFLGLSARRFPQSVDAPKDGSASDSSVSTPQTPRAQPGNRASAVQEPRLEDFPRPAASKPLMGPRPQKDHSRRSSSIGRQISLTRNSIEGRPGLRPRPSASPVRSGSAALQAAQRSSAQMTAAVPAMPAQSSSRRQSQLPPSSAPPRTAAKQPRKSIGPGFTFASAREKTVFDPASRTFVPDTSVSRNSDSLRKAPADATKPRQSHVSTASTTSFSSDQERPKHLSTSSSNLPLMPSMQEDGSRASNSQTIPQPSSSRRQSNAATYVGGLGARTVSPTDFRRSRRLSTATAHHVPSPSPELVLTQRPPPTPPATAFHKPSTPNSARATPDVSHAMHQARSAASSRSSYTSVRPMSSSSQNRSSIGPGHGKPPKPRSAHNSAGGEDELVPPVPAIPKAFESPTELLEKPFFMHDVVTGNYSGPSTAADEKDDRPFMTPEERKADPSTGPGDPRVGRRLTFAGRSDAIREANGLAGTRQQQEAMQLPPLNLLPLGTPTAAKIASIAQGNKPSGSEGMSATPPPYRSFNKTPSTPMTASKAVGPTFDNFKSLGLDIPEPTPPFRANTAAALQRSDTFATDGTSSASPGVFATASPATPRHGPSPFGSFSLPRLNGELQFLPTRTTREDSQETPQPQASRRTSNFIHRRPSTKAGKESAAANPPNSAGAGAETEAAASTSSALRRKLSFGWRRSSSKASHSGQHPDDDAVFQSSNEMPPPKLPASAMLNSQGKSPKLGPTKTPKSSEPMLTLKGLQSRNSSTSELPRPSKGAAADRSGPTTRSSSSLFSVPKMLAARSSQNALKAAARAQEAAPVAEDAAIAAADDEMRKLGSRRRESELAAKELDELRKRAQPKDCVSPSQAASVANLNLFERGEIIDYRDVYFCGTRGAQKIVGDLASESSNFGFDDERGDYKIVLGDHLAYRYEVIDVLGKGSFGQVVRCIDHKKGDLVAIKIIRNKKRFHQQALVEVNILQRLREWDPRNVHSMITFTQSFYFRGHLCISTELLDMNLYEFIKAHEFMGFSLRIIRRFTKQILASLVLLQSRNVIHCDLKPENILLAHPLRSELKVIDFGSSCFENEKVYTYIQSRFYRSPEVILGMTYGLPIDMWSVGCILAELRTGYPIFPGENEQEQLACIMEVFGPPEKHLIERSSRKKLFFDSLGKPRITVSSKGKRRRPSSKTLSQALKCDDEAFLDFITQCLRWDPDRRMKPDEAMEHEFVTGVKKPAARMRSTASPAKRVTTQPSISAIRGKVAGDLAASVTSARASQSPAKAASGASRRKSTMYEQTNNSKSSVGPQSSTSSLPRITQAQRSTSGKPDLASAAAIASLSGSAGGMGRGRNGHV